MGVAEYGIRDIYERNHVGFTGKFNAMQICNGGTSAKVAELKLKVKVNKILYLHSNCVTEVDRSLQLYDGTLNFSILLWFWQAVSEAFEFFYPSTVFQFSFYSV